MSVETIFPMVVAVILIGWLSLTVIVFVGILISLKSKQIPPDSDSDSTDETPD